MGRWGEGGERRGEHHGRCYGAPPRVKECAPLTHTVSGEREWPGGHTHLEALEGGDPLRYGGPYLVLKHVVVDGEVAFLPVVWVVVRRGRLAAEKIPAPPFPAHVAARRVHEHGAVLRAWWAVE